MEGFGRLERLYNAATTGNILELNELLEDYPLLLHTSSFTCPNKTPLHVATMHGHLQIVEAILERNRHLAEQLDFQHTSPLHIAADRGNVAIVTALVNAAPDVCMSRDYQGRNPLHLAAIKGHENVLTVLVQVVPLAAREKADRGQTALHLCIKHRQLGALMFLVDRLGDMINAKDEDGNTALHLAVRDNHGPAITHLVANGIDVNATNYMGQTAGDILNNNTRPQNWLSEKRDSIMVVAVLIATMAFQAVVSPPGGVWQDNLTLDAQGRPMSNPHRAGEAIMAYRKGTAFHGFIHSNSAAFISSLSTILLLISGLPFGRNRFFLWFLMVIMWVNVTSIVITYVIVLNVVSPREDMSKVRHVAVVGMILWCGVMGILLVGNMFRFRRRWVNNRVL